MQNRTLVVFILFSVGTALHLPAQGVDSERKLFSQVKARADKGDAEAQLQLGSFYENGTGVAPDPVKAFKWYRRAAERGLAAAQFQVGLDYASGTGVKRDPPQSVHWFRAAAEKDFTQAQLELGLCYLEGRGISQNEVEALKWFRSASGRGLAYADYEIGNCYLQGVGVAKDVEDGVKWIKQAAEKGVAAAQTSLGQAYEKGEGLPKDYVQAYKWYSLAASHDDEHAADIRVSLAKLEVNLTKEQIAQAQHLAHEFKPTEAADVDSTTTKESLWPQQTTNPASASSTKAASQTGLVLVKANDEDCEVSVDGAFVGNSPAKVQLAEGPHLFEVKKPGFKSYKREVKVTPGSELSLRVVLEKE